MQKGNLWILVILFLVVLVITVLLSSCRSSGDTSDTDSGAVLTFDSFDGGGPDYDVTVSDPAVLTCSSERHYAKSNHEELEGASYTITYTFRGKTPGETTVTVSAHSPIGDNFDTVYKAVVDDKLSVTLTELERTDEYDRAAEPVPTLVMVVNDTTFYPYLADTPAANQLVEKLSTEPIELTLHDYGSFEKTGTLPWSLPQDDQTLTTKAGDILLYNGDQVCLYYDENTWDFTRLAAIPDTSREAFLKILGDGDVHVQMWVEWSE